VRKNDGTSNNVGEFPDRTGLPFVGRITGSVTHELSNVISTIEQVAGLLADLVETNPVLEDGLTARLHDISGRIERQTERGTVLIRELNFFSHLSDKESAEFDLTEVVRNIAVLSRRFANLQKKEILTTGLEHDVMIESDPLMISQLVFNALMIGLQGAESAEPVTVAVTKCDQHATITVNSKTSIGSPHLEASESLQRLAAELKCEVESNVVTGELRISVKCPPRRSTAE